MDKQKLVLVDNYDIKMLIIILNIIGLSLADGIFTLILIDNGASEINPVGVAINSTVCETDVIAFIKPSGIIVIVRNHASSERTATHVGLYCAIVAPTDPCSIDLNRSCKI